jgi:hypothetical protein
MGDGHGLTARHLPEVRAELVQWLADPGPGGGPAVWSEGQEPQQAAAERRAAGTWSASLAAAELFYISADMTRLAVSAGLALPSYRLHPEELPAPHGLLVWQEPVTTAYDTSEQVGCPIIAVSWAVHGARVHLRTWTHRDWWIADMAKGSRETGIAPFTAAEVRDLRRRYPQQLVCMSQARMPFEKVPGWLSSMPDDTSGLSLVELEAHSRAGTRQEQLERALLVTWLLMGQTLAREEQAEAPRSSVRGIRRINPDLLTTVRYVQLRHQKIPGQGGEAGTGNGRGYKHQWVVRGHWRNHWYPSRGASRPIWIESHVKGPDGAPLLDPGKLVNVLRR